PTLDDARMQIPAFYLPVTALPAIGVDTGSGASLFGLPVQGNLAMRFVNDGAQFDVGLALPQLGNLSAAAAFKVFNDGPFQLDGKFIYQAGDPAAYAFTGDAKLVGHQLASAGLEYHTNGYFHAFGKIGFHVGPNNAFGVDGSVDGWATKSAFEVDGQLGVTAPGGFSIRGKGLVS